MKLRVDHSLVKRERERELQYKRFVIQTRVHLCTFQVLPFSPPLPPFSTHEYRQADGPMALALSQLYFSMLKVTFSSLGQMKISPESFSSTFFSRHSDKGFFYCRAWKNSGQMD